MKHHVDRAKPSRQRHAAAQREPGTGDAAQGPVHAREAAQGQRIAAAFGDGLPARLQRGIEALSGVSMAGVQVHRDSAIPAQLGALAFAQGTDIHLGPGQEQHLPHEAWHVVQQAQGRVTPDAQWKAAPGAAMPLNADHALEAEADRMGEQSLRAGHSAGATAPGRGGPTLAPARAAAGVVQRFTSGGTVEENKFAYDKNGSESAVDFRLRMKLEMDAHRQQMADSDSGLLPATKADLPARPGKVLEPDQEAPSVEAIKKRTSGEFESTPDALGVTRTDTYTALAPNKTPVTGGATVGQTAPPVSITGAKTSPAQGSIKSMKTLSGGPISALENQLNHPVSTADRPREGMVERQKHIMAAAKAADPLMNSLDGPTHKLPADYQREKDVYSNSGNAKPGFKKQQDGTLAATGNPVNWLKTDPGGADVHVIGMDEFKNRPTHTNGVEKSLPELDTSQAPADYHSGVNATKNAYLSGHAKENKPGVWGEADLDHDSHDPGVHVSERGRGANRLHYTDPGSKDLKTGQPVNYNYAVTTDHYESAVGVTPVQTDYKNSNPYTPKYADPSGGLNSLEHHEEQAYAKEHPPAPLSGKAAPLGPGEEDALRDKALRDAQASSARREKLENDRTDSDLSRLTTDLAPVADMYGRSPASMAPGELEQQLLKAQTHTDPREPEPEPEPAPPMSQSALDMYG